jgi:hypothetical protein
LASVLQEIHLMKMFLIATAIVEVGAGLAFLALPSWTAELLLGIGFDSPSGGIVARLAGAALLTIGIACWLGKLDEESRASRGLVAAMLVYNTAATSLLAYSGMTLELVGLVLWPAVGLHLVMTIWCLGCLKKQPRL